MVGELGPLQVHKGKIRKLDVAIARNYFPLITFENQPEEIEVYESTYPITVDTPSQEYDIIGAVDSPITRMGSKSQLLEWLLPRFPRGVAAYVEPFGGAFRVLLGKPWSDRIEIINDIDADLVHFFRWVRFAPDALAQLINETPTHEALIMGLRQELADRELNGIVRAAAWYIHNCAAFNATAGAYASSPSVLLDTSVDADLLRRVAKRMMKTDIRSTSYKRVIESANKKVAHGKVFFYLDPPYLDTQDYETLQGRSSDFGHQEQRALRDCCVDIHQMGNLFIQTNAWHDYLYKIYSEPKCFFITSRDVRYSVSGSGESRGDRKEIIISNFDLLKIKEQGRLV